MITERDTAYFISDAHLGADSRRPEQGEEHILAFFGRIRDHATHLFILGDLFDFWIEYAHAIRPRYFPVLHGLKTLADAGVSIHCLAGNHDFALGPFIEHTIGIRLHGNHSDIVVQEKMVHLYHGDGVRRAVVGYRVLRGLLRNRVLQWLYKLLHPDIGVPLGMWVSGLSRHFHVDKLTEEARREYLMYAQRYLDKDHDIVVYGHTHVPGIWTSDGKVCCNTGDWTRHYTYATMKAGVMTLWRYIPGQSPLEIKPYPPKYDASAS